MITGSVLNEPAMWILLKCAFYTMALLVIRVFYAISAGSWEAPMKKLAFVEALGNGAHLGIRIGG